MDILDQPEIPKKTTAPRNYLGQAVRLAYIVVALRLLAFLLNYYGNVPLSLTAAGMIILTAVASSFGIFYLYKADDEIKKREPRYRRHFKRSMIVHVVNLILFIIALSIELFNLFI